MCEEESMEPTSFDSDSFESPEPTPTTTPPPPQEYTDLTPVLTPPPASPHMITVVGGEDDDDDDDEDEEEEEDSDSTSHIGGVKIKGKYSPDTHTITATWSFSGGGVAEAGKDWVGLYIYGRADNKSHYTWAYVPASGHLEFTPKYNGYYDLRYFVKGAAEPVARSGRILVGREKPICVEVRPRQSDDDDCEGTLCVDFSVFDGENGKDWIGLYKTSTKSNRDYICTYSPKDGSGVTAVTVPPKVDGECHLRYFFYDSTSYQYGYFCSGYSPSFTVNANNGTVTLTSSSSSSSATVNNFEQKPKAKAKAKEEEIFSGEKVQIWASVEGDTAKVSWRYADTYVPTDQDTVTLTICNRADNRSFAAAKIVKTETSGCACIFPLQYRGLYEVRYFDYGVRWLGADNKAPLASSASFLYGPPAGIEALDKAEDNAILATCLNKTDTSERDVIALYRADECSNSHYIEYKNVGRACRDDSMIRFDRPRDNGAYELRYFYADSWDVRFMQFLASSYFCSGCSKKIVVENVSHIDLRMDEEADILTVEYHCQGVRPSQNDWIGIFESADDRAGYVGYQYCLDVVGGFAKKNATNSGRIDFRLSARPYAGKSRSEWEVRYVQGKDSAHPVARTLYKDT